MGMIINPLTGKFDDIWKGNWWGATNSNLYYKEPATAPATAPQSWATNAIAIGDGAKALSYGMIVWWSQAGIGATAAELSIMMGEWAGNNAQNAQKSNFIWVTAWANANDAFESNFIWVNAWLWAMNANQSTFIWLESWFNAKDAFRSLFIGHVAWSQATNANSAVFIWLFAWQNATEWYDAIYIGHDAGRDALRSPNSIYIGRSAWFNDTVNNTLSTDDFNILIGNDINTWNFNNSILLWSGITWTPVSNTMNNQFMLADRITNMRLQLVAYADDADAGANWLTTGDWYQTNGGNPLFTSWMVFVKL